MQYMRYQDNKTQKGFTLLESIIGVFIVFIAVSSLSALFIDLSHVTGKANTSKQMAHLAKAVIDATLESAYDTTGYDAIGDLPWGNGTNLAPIVQGFDQAFLGSVQYRRQVSSRNINLEDPSTHISPPPYVENFKKVQLDFTGPYNISFTTTFLVPTP